MVQLVLAENVAELMNVTTETFVQDQFCTRTFKQLYAWGEIDGSDLVRKLGVHDPKAEARLAAQREAWNAANAGRTRIIPYNHDEAVTSSACATQRSDGNSAQPQQACETDVQQVQLHHACEAGTEHTQ